MRRDVHDQQMSLAWHTAALALSGFAGKLPKLATLLAPQPEQRQSVEQMRGMLTMIGLKPARHDGRQ
jgi:hypothetical protein